MSAALKEDEVLLMKWEFNGQRWTQGFSFCFTPALVFIYNDSYGSRAIYFTWLFWSAGVTWWKKGCGDDGQT